MLGLPLGLALGLALGLTVGDALGDCEGETVGLSEGLALGDALGLALGLTLGLSLGLLDGAGVGLLLGLPLGETLGLLDGAGVGLLLGLPLGETLGDSDGDRLGVGVGFGWPRQHLNWRPPVPGLKFRWCQPRQPACSKYVTSAGSSSMRIVPGQNLRQYVREPTCASHCPLTSHGTPLPYAPPKPLWRQPLTQSGSLYHPLLPFPSSAVLSSRTMFTFPHHVL